jgi:hypothetical protein
MNPVRWKYLSAAFLVVSVVLLAGIVVLPQWKTPQKAVYSGPLETAAPDGSAISGFYIPTVDNGSRITVSFYNFIPGALDFSIFPSEVGGVAPTSPGIFVKTPVINSTQYFPAAATEPYGIYVITRNFTRFTLIIQATYSPYYWLTTYSSIAVAMVLGSVVLLYYYTFTSRRWALEQKAIREATSEEDKGR